MMKALLIMIILTTACSALQRSPGSGYADRSSQATNSGWEKSNDSAIPSRAAESPAPVDTKVRLKQLENQLSSQRELDQYSKALPWMKSDEEKVAFLSEGSYEAKQKWLQVNDLHGRSMRITSQLQDVVAAQDIAMGMPFSLVKKSWGEPQGVEVSGKPAFGNQRWKYSKYVSTPDGFKTEQKTVFFEGGKVIGWDVE